jgi:hypothetical protein
MSDILKNYPSYNVNFLVVIRDSGREKWKIGNNPTYMAAVECECAAVLCLLFRGCSSQ